MDSKKKRKKKSKASTRHFSQGNISFLLKIRKPLNERSQENKILQLYTMYLQYIENILNSIPSKKSNNLYHLLSQYR